MNIVFFSLKCRPYEPLSAEGLKHFTMKTLFLVALAMAHRIGELQALSSSVGFNKDGSAILSFAHDFVAKTQLKDRSVLRDFVIPSLKSITDDKDELLLCPVRALKLYLKVTRFESRANRLFVSPRDFSKPLSKNAISFFLRSVIIDAYSSIPEKWVKISKVNAHEIRAVATSLRFKYNINEIDIKSAYWRLNSIFCSRYLRDPTHSYLDVSGLGPLIVAQGIVQHVD